MPKNTGITYGIRVSAQKGGVGTTTIAINLAAALGLMGKKVLLLDLNPFKPSVASYMGLPNSKVGFFDVLFDGAELKDAVVEHSPTGIDVVASSKPLEWTRVLGGLVGKKTDFERIVPEITALGHDFVITDAPIGYINEDMVKNFNEGLVVLSPELSAFDVTPKLVAQYAKLGVSYHVVVNDIGSEKASVDVKKIEEEFGNKVVAELPHDNVVKKSIDLHIPAVLVDNKSNFSKKITELAEYYADK